MKHEIPVDYANRLVVEGMIEKNIISLTSRGSGEIVTIQLEIGRDRNPQHGEIKSFSPGRIVRVTIEEVDTNDD